MAPSRRDDYLLAYQQAARELARANLRDCCFKSGATYQVAEENQITIFLDYLGRTYSIRLPQVEISFLDSNEEVPWERKIILLHYLNTAQGIPLSGELITFREVPGGAFYYSAFVKRVKEPLLKAFGKEPQLLIEAALSLRGYKADYGDVAVTIPAFPKVPVTLVLWQGNREFPPEGNILFDSTIPCYLPTEDIAVMCQMMVKSLIRQNAL